MNSPNGLTLIELLVATVLLGVIITVILAPLAGLFRITGESGRTLQASTQAQEVIEYVRGQWQDRDKYDKSCVASTAQTGGATITVVNLDSNANELSTSSLAGSCGGTPPSNPPLMKRLTVTITSNDGVSQAVITVDIPRP